MPTDYFLPIAEGDDQPRLSDTDKQELVADACKDWHNWARMTSPIRERSQESRQLYFENRPDHLEYNDADDAGQSLSRLRRPVMAQAIDSTLAQQHLACFPLDESFYKIRPKNELANDKLDSYDRLTQQRLSAIEFMANTYKDEQNRMLDGASLVWHPFIRDTEQVVTYEQRKVLGLAVPGKPKKTTKEGVTLEATGFIPVAFHDWLVDPMSDSFKEASLIWRRWVSVDSLKDVEAFENTEDLQSYQTEWDELESDRRETFRLMGIEPTYNETESPLSCDMVLLYERWGDFYQDDKYYPNHVLIYSNDTNFHYFGPNPYDHQRKPFTLTPYIPIAGTLYGKSLAQDIIPLAHAQDAMLNQTIDILSRTANPTFTYRIDDTAIGEFFSNGTPSLLPAEGIPCQDHDNIRPLIWDMSAVGILQNSMQVIKDEIRESTGGVPYATGGASEADTQRTLGEVEILSQGTNTRYQMFIQTYEEGRLKPYLEMIFMNDRQFMTEKVWVEDDTEPLTPNTVKMMDLRFDVTGSKTIQNKAREMQEFDSILNNFIPAMVQAGVAKFNGDIVIWNPGELTKRRLSMSNFRDVDTVMEVKTAEEQAEEQAEMPPQLPGAPPNEPPILQGPQPGPQAGNMAILGAQ